MKFKINSTYIIRRIPFLSLSILCRFGIIILFSLLFLSLSSCSEKSQNTIRETVNAFTSKLSLSDRFYGVDISILSSESYTPLSSLLVSEYEKEYNIKDDSISMETKNLADYPFTKYPDIIISPLIPDFQGNTDNTNILAYKYATFIIAYDNFVFIQDANTMYQLDNISQEQMLFMWSSTNKINSWNEIDPTFPSSHITYISLNKNSDFILSFVQIMKIVTTQYSLDLQNDYNFSLLYDIDLNNYEDIFTRVTQNTNSIGLISLSNLQRELYHKSFSIGSLPHIITIEGESPVHQNNDTMLQLPLGKTNANYSLQYPIYVYLSQDSFKDEKVLHFIKFMFSKKINYTLDRNGYLPLSYKQKQKSISDLTTSMQIYLEKDPELNL